MSLKRKHWGEAAAIGRSCYPKSNKPFLGYGTAGFRTSAEHLEHVMFRMGVFAALRSKSQNGKAIGVMITASHNPERDNGVKLVDPHGEMLDQSWESYATRLANAEDDNLEQEIGQVVEELKIQLDAPAKVIVGRDTRATGTRFALAVVDGVGAVLPAVSRSIGIVTTPQLHYAVSCENAPSNDASPTVQGYTDRFVRAFNALVEGTSTGTKYSTALTVDCANGVGSWALKSMSGRLASNLQLSLCNAGEGGLNEGCGADFVKLKQQAPAGCTDLVEGKRYATVDGDADRLMYFFNDGSGFSLLDGDRLALLLADFMAELLAQAGLASDQLQLGLVQTAYANGASTEKAVAALGSANVACAKTGVKHCHHAALSFDVGLYFEANGHGTAIFSEKFVKTVTDASKSDDGKVAAAAKQLLMLRMCINETVGDAVSIILVVEAILRLRDWSCKEWLAMYTDLPYRQVKVAVADRGAFETTDAERKCLKPEGLQASLDALVAKAPKGRAFVRPSGTEDVVRVYAEAATSEAMLELAQAAVDLVFDKAGGVGARPKVS
jgi:phosphoacetylglucosamine mutase